MTIALLQSPISPPPPLGQGVANTPFEAANAGNTGETSFSGVLAALHGKIAPAPSAEQVTRPGASTTLASTRTGADARFAPSRAMIGPSVGPLVGAKVDETIGDALVNPPGGTAGDTAGSKLEAPADPGLLLAMLADVTSTTPIAPPEIPAAFVAAAMVAAVGANPPPARAVAPGVPSIRQHEQEPVVRDAKGAASAANGASNPAAFVAFDSQSPGLASATEPPAATRSVREAPELPTALADKSSGYDALGSASAAAPATPQPATAIELPAISALRSEAVLPVTVSIPTPVNHPHFVQEAAQQVSWMVGKGIEQARVNVTPVDLGPIEIRISLKADEATINFAVHHPETGAAIENALPRLREMLAANGISLGQTAVDTGAQGFGGNLNGFADDHNPENRQQRHTQNAEGGLAPSAATLRTLTGSNLIDLFA